MQLGWSENVCKFARISYCTRSSDESLSLFYSFLCPPLFAQTDQIDIISSGRVMYGYWYLGISFADDSTSQKAMSTARLTFKSLLILCLCDIEIHMDKII